MKKINVLGAPMAGVTDLPFRKMIRKFGGQLIFSEMVPADLMRDKPWIKKQIEEIKNEQNVGVQLLGRNAAAMARAAQMAEQAGAVVIDINMGCPMRKLIQSRVGCYLMREPELAAEIAATVIKAVNIPVSVKTRIGVDDKHITVVDFVKRLEDVGISSVTVHGRTQKQMYGGYSDNTWIARVKGAVNIPVVANGDVVDRAAAEKVLEVTRADGVMVGRGMLGRPWILSEIVGEKAFGIDLKKVMLEHYELLLSYYGKQGVLIGRKHLAWYAKNYPDSGNFIAEMNKGEQAEDVVNIINKYII